MGAVRARVAADLRAHWASTLVLVLLVALAGGAVLTTVAGARRTASAYPRMLEEANAYDVFVVPESGQIDFEAIDALPQVADSARVIGQFAIPLLPSGEPDLASIDDFVSASSDGRWGYEANRPVNLEGRLPAPDRIEEIALSRPLAEAWDLGVGDRLPLGAVVDPEGERFDRIEAEVVGVGLFPQDALQDTESQTAFPVLFLGPAFAEKYAFAATYAATLVRVDGGAAGLAKLSASVQQIAAGEEEGQVFLQTQAATTDKAQRALRPYAVALAVFAGATGLASLLVVGQALTRQLLAGATSVPILSALGMTQVQLLAATVLRAVAVGIGGGLLAVVLAVALSPLMPIGSARDIDPDPGLDVDTPVLVAGLAAVMLLASLWGLAVGWRATRLAAARTALQAVPRRSRLTELLARAGTPAPTAAGVRMAVEPGRGATAVPVRTTLVGAALGLGALVAAVTFGAGLDHFLDTPRLYGWNWDAMVRADVDVEGQGPEVVEFLSDHRSVAAVSGGSYGQLDVGGTSVATIGLGEGAADVYPPLLEGRPAATPDEVVLGTTTLERLGREVGDEVELAVGDTTRRAEVVGRAVFPRFAQYPGSDKTGLGIGAVLTVDGLGQFIEDAGVLFGLVRLEPGADPGQLGADLTEAFPPDDPNDPEEGVIVVTDPERPDDLVGYERVNATPLVLASLLALLAVGTTAHGLVSAVRRRRRDLALLKTLGFTRRQVSAAVAWSATTVAVVALVVGLPLGVAAGRTLWALLADQLGAIEEPVTPVLAVLVAVPATLIFANLVAAFPGRRAGAIHPAVALRAE